jgi:serine/threonine protein kinase
MAILVTCPKCGNSASASDKAEGRKVRCKQCDHTFVARPTIDGDVQNTDEDKTANSNPFSKLPAEFGRYRVLRLLGRGGMGAVYLAEDTQLKRQVALKIPFFGKGESSQRIARFLREAQSAAALHHPNICTIFDVGQINDQPFLTMALISGQELEKLIDPHRPMDQRVAAEIVRKVALACQKAHQIGIIHRDLKPANIMINDENDPVVMDFGLAKRVGDQDPGEAKLTRAGGMVGTPSYMSPEQVVGSEQITHATDIYSLGVILFEMLTGRTPYRGAMTQIIGQILAAPVPAAREIHERVDPELEEICRKAMAKNPEERFRSMSEFAEALERYLRPPAAPPPLTVVPSVSVEVVPVVVHSPVTTFVEEPEPISRPRRKKRRSSLMWVVALVLMVPLGVLLALVLVLRVETPEGTLVVEMDGDEVEAKIKGGKLVLAGADGKTRYTLSAKERTKTLAEGGYTLRVEGADGLSVDTSEFTLKKGRKVTVRVRLDSAVAKKELPKNTTPEEIGNKEPVPQGFTSLFNGRDLTGWEVNQGGQLALWGATNGVLHANGGGGGWLMTEKDYQDFQLRLDFKLPEKGNSGVALRSSMIGNPATDAGIEIQLRDELLHLRKWKGMKSDLFTGSIWGIVPPSRRATKPIGEWNKMQIVAQGRRVRVQLNGVDIVDANLDDHRDKLAKHPGILRTKGRIGLQSSEGRVEFRNIVVKELNTGAGNGGFLDKNLATWEGLIKEYWTFKDGELVGSTEGNELKSHTYLCSKKKYKDFELKFKVKLKNGIGNSGVHIRSKIIDVKSYIVAGPQCDIGERYWGSLYGENTSGMMKAAPMIVQDSIKSTEFNDYYIRCIGNRVTIKINGVTSVDEEFDTLPEDGIIAFQLHCRVPFEVRFKDIEFTDLTQIKADAFKANSVWVSNSEPRITLTVIERDGDKFVARFVIGNVIEREIRGTFAAGKVSWLAKDVLAIKGLSGGDNEGTIGRDKDGDFINFTWRDEEKRTGAFVLRRELK